MIHNAEEKLCNLLSIRWSIQWYCKLQNVLPTFHVPSCYNKLHLFDGLSARTQTSLVLVKQFSFINRNVSQGDTIPCFNIFPLFATEFSQSSEIQQIKWSTYPEMQHKICTIQIHLTRINHSHDPCFLLGIFFSADLTWLDTFIWFSLELLLSQWRNTIQPRQLMLLSSQYPELAHWKQPQMIANLLNRVRSENSHKKKFQNNTWLVDGHEVWLWSWVQLKHPWQA